MKIIVSHIGKQHVNALLLGLLKHNMLSFFYTSIAANKFTPPQYLGKNWVSKIKKQHFTGIPNEKIIHFLPIALVRKLIKSEYWSVKFPYKWFDKAVAGRLKDADFDLLIGYETANLISFKMAKQQGKITVLDFASVHHTFQDVILTKAGTFKNQAELSYISDLKDQAFAYTDYVIVLSNFAEKTLIDSGFPAERVYKTYLGVNHNIFTPKTNYNTHDFGFRISDFGRDTKDGINHNKYAINPISTPPKSQIPNPKLLELYFVGTLSHRKGVPFMIQLLNALIERGLDIRLTLIGPVDDVDVPVLEATYFRYIPFLNHVELVNMHHALDLFIFPSYIDSWAQVVIEAMACGSPVLVSENTGAKDAVEQGGGVVLPVGNLMAWVSAVEFFYYNRSFLKKTGEKAAVIAKQYTWEAYHQQIFDTLSDIAARTSVRKKVTTELAL